jgi:hypothetical protein
MTIGFTKKLLVVGASATVLALGAVPAGFAGEDNGPTANGEKVGAVQTNSASSGNSSASSGSSSASSGSSSASSKGSVKSARKTLVARRDTVKAQGAAQTGFGGMADTPGGSALFALLLGFGGVALIGAARLGPLGRSSDR